MLIQKTFHLHAPMEVAKARLQDVAGYRRHFENVEMAVVTPEGKVHFMFRLPWGFHGDVELTQFPGENPAQTLFRSTRGNMAVLGVLEYFQIRPTLTEIVLTLDYTINSPLFRLIDRIGNSMDAFLNRQLECLEIHFTKPLDGVRVDDTILPAPIDRFPAPEGAE